MRTGAVIEAVADEIKDRIWTVPAGRMKGEQSKEKPEDFRVPLSAPAVAIVAQMRTGAATAFCFPAGNAAGRSAIWGC